MPTSCPCSLPLATTCYLGPRYSWRRTQSQCTPLPSLLAATNAKLRNGKPTAQCSLHLQLHLQLAERYNQSSAAAQQQGSMLRVYYGLTLATSSHILNGAGKELAIAPDCDSMLQRLQPCPLL